MFENIAPILPELWVATGQTFLMLAIGLSAACCSCSARASRSTTGLRSWCSTGS